MDNQQIDMHPELAFQAGIPQARKQYEVHPSLQMEMMPEEEPVVEKQAQPEQEMVESTTPTPQEAPPAPVEAPKDRDWRVVRARADEAKQLAREKEALERERDFYRQQALEKRNAVPQEDDYRTETEKRLGYEMEQLKRQSEAQAKEIEETKRRAAQWRAEAELTRDYPDFNNVVTKDNVERLETEFPHLFNAAVSTSDVYATGSTAYELIVAKGIYKKPVNTLKQLTQSDTIARNLSKPRSSSSISPQSGENPIKHANTFTGTMSTEDERKALYAEMVASSRNKY